MFVQQITSGAFLMQEAAKSTLIEYKYMNIKYLVNHEKETLVKPER
jgi:hypothetical protein